MPGDPALLGQGRPLPPRESGERVVADVPHHCARVQPMPSHAWALPTAGATRNSPAGVPTASHGAKPQQQDGKVRSSRALARAPGPRSWGPPQLGLALTDTDIL